MKKILLVPIASLILTGCSNQNNKDINPDSNIKNTYKTLITSDSQLDISILKDTLSTYEFIEDKYLIMDNDSISHRDVLSYSFKSKNELLNIEVLDDNDINLTYQAENNKENSSSLSYNFNITQNTSRNTIYANYLFSDAQSKEYFIDNQNTMRKFDDQSYIYITFINLEKDIQSGISINNLENELKLDFQITNNDTNIDYVHSNNNEKLILTVDKFNTITGISYENSDITSYTYYNTIDTDYIYGITINDINNQELKSL